MSVHRLGVLALYLSDKQLEELSFFRKLSVYGQKLGLEVAVFTPADLHKDNKHVQALFYNVQTKKWGRKWIPFPPLIYDRCRYHGKENFLKLQAFRSKFNSRLRYLARPLANKMTLHSVLSEHDEINRHLPDTIIYNGLQGLLRMLKKHKVVYLKPKNGTGGRGIVRIEALDHGKYLVRGRNKQRLIIPPLQTAADGLLDNLRLWNVDGKYVVQQGIPLTLSDGRVHDYRLLVQKNGIGEWKVTGCAGRIGPHRSITSNLHGGGTAAAMEKLLLRQLENKASIAIVKKEIYALGLQIADFLENKYGSLCELGIDIAVDPKGGVWMLEVNPKPSREVFNRIGKHDAYRSAIMRPLEYALWVLNEKPKEQIKPLQNISVDNDKSFVQPHIASEHE